MQHQTSTETLEAVAARLHNGAEELRSTVSDWDERLRTVCRERPFTVLAGALCAGFLIGRLLSRR